ncbi:hypothetical protein HDU76_010696, partial [Blyttiomyces sp. JEL0837]
SCAQGTPNNNCGGGGGGGNGGGGGGGSSGSWNSILIKGGQKAIGTQLQVWTSTGVGQQLYQFQPAPVGGKSFQIAFTLPAVEGGTWIRDVNSGRCLAVSTLGMNDGDKIFIWDCENNPNPQTIVWGINGKAPGPVKRHGLGPQPDTSYGGIWNVTRPGDTANGQIIKAIYEHDLPGSGDDKQFSGVNIGTCYAQFHALE